MCCWYLHTVTILLLILVNIKWGKEKFQDVDVNTDESPELFQAQIFALSGVPPERQKIMAKGKTLKVMSIILFTFMISIKSILCVCAGKTSFLFCVVF